jgi:hypothetical protein
VPLDAYEEAQFHRITAQLREEDPALGRTGRWHRAWHGLGPIGAGLLLVAALATLPLALVSNLYPLGLLGYVAATFAGVRLAAIYLPRLRDRAAAGDVPEGATEDEKPAVNRSGMLWGALVGAAALAAVVALAPGGAADRGAATDPAPDAPAATSVEPSDDEAAPNLGRSSERPSAADGS